MSLAKLAVELTKGAVKTYAVFPYTTVLGFLIDTVTAQENATRGALERIEGMVSDMQENPLRVGRNFLEKANRVKDTRLKRDRIIKAQDEFVKASHWKTSRDPLLPVKAEFFTGVCDDLLEEPEAALETYETVFKKLKELERIVPNNASYDRSILDRVEDFLDFFSFPGDYIEEWFDKRGSKHKARQELLDQLYFQKDEIKSLVENLLTIITKRKGVTRETYLKPWAPKKRPSLFGGQRPLFLRQPGGGNPPAPTIRGASLMGGPGLRGDAPSVCPTCRTLRRLGVCPQCRGKKKVPLEARFPKGLQVNCARCAGTGRAYVCQCDGEGAAPRQLSGKKCLVCRGTGKLTDGITRCLVCGGTGVWKP